MKKVIEWLQIIKYKIILDYGKQKKIKHSFKIIISLILTINYIVPPCEKSNCLRILETIKTI